MKNLFNKPKPATAPAVPDKVPPQVNPPLEYVLRGYTDGNRSAVFQEMGDQGFYWLGVDSTAGKAVFVRVKSNGV